MNCFAMKRSSEEFQSFNVGNAKWGGKCECFNPTILNPTANMHRRRR